LPMAVSIESGFDVSAVEPQGFCGSASGNATVWGAITVPIQASLHGCTEGDDKRDPNAAY